MYDESNSTNDENYSRKSSLTLSGEIETSALTSLKQLRLHFSSLLKEVDRSPTFMRIPIFFFFVQFLYRRSSAIISWSSTDVLFWNHMGTLCAGGHPNVPFSLLPLLGLEPMQAQSEQQVPIIPPALLLLSF